MGQHTTGEKVPELLLHERRQAGALGVVSRRIEERERKARGTAAPPLIPLTTVS